MPDTLSLPFLKEMVQDGLTYGASYLVEFEPQSLWYEASLTIAAQAVKHGIRTDYHTYMHIPDEVREALGRLGVDVKRLEEEDQLRVIDSYTITTGLGFPESSDKGRERYRSRSLDMKDWGTNYLLEIKEGVPETEKRRLHLDDNTSVGVQYNSEKTYLDVWRTKGVLWTRKTETAVFTSIIRGAHSETLYSKLEPITDGIIDFRSREENGQMEHYFRVRTMRGKTCDSRWRHLSLLDTGEVVIDSIHKVSKAEAMDREQYSPTLLEGPRSPQSIQEMRFDTERAREVFRLLAKAFVNDYMFKRMYVEKACWRSLMDLIRESSLPRSAFYGPMRRKGPVLTELERRGLIEARFFPEERGRGGEVTKLRVTYENGLVRKLVEQVAMETTRKS